MTEKILCQFKIAFKISNIRKLLILITFKKQFKENNKHAMQNDFPKQCMLAGWLASKSNTVSP